MAFWRPGTLGTPNCRVELRTRVCHLNKDCKFLTLVCHVFQLNLGFLCFICWHNGEVHNDGGLNDDNHGKTFFEDSERYFQNCVEMLGSTVFNINNHNHVHGLNARTIAQNGEYGLFGQKRVNE